MKKAVVHSLIGSAVLLACGAVQAATVGVVTPTSSSVEKNTVDAAANGAASVTLPALTFTLAGTGYVDGDVVTVSFTGGNLRLASAGTVDSTNIQCRGQAVAGTTVDAFTLTLTGATDQRLTYTLSARNPAVVIAGPTGGAATTCTIGLPVKAGDGSTTSTTRLDMLASSLTTSKSVSVNWSAASNSGVVHDALTNSAGNAATAITIHRAVSQFGAIAWGPDVTLRLSPTATAFTSGASAGANVTWQDDTSCVIRRSSASATAGSAPSTSCNANRGSGYSGGKTSATHGLYMNDDYPGLPTSFGGLGAATGAASNAADVVINWTGNFSFIDNDNNGCTLADLTNGYARISFNRQSGADIGTGTNTAVTPVAISSDCTQIQTLTPFTAGVSNLVSLVASVRNVTASSNGARAIPEQTITAVATIRNAAGTVLNTSSTAVAQYIQDSQSADINYMPYGPGISRIVYVTNNNVTAPVTITATNESGTACAATNFPAVTATAGRPTSLSTALDAGVATCYGAAYNGKVKFSITLSVRRADQYTLRLSEMTVTPRKAAATVTVDGIPYASNRDQAATIGAADAEVATIAAQTGSIARVADPFEIYSAYNVNGNRVQVINSTNGR